MQPASNSRPISFLISVGDYFPTLNLRHGAWGALPTLPAGAFVRSCLLQKLSSVVLLPRQAAAEKPEL